MRATSLSAATVYNPESQAFRRQRRLPEVRMRAAQLAVQWLASLATVGFLLVSPAQAQTGVGEVEFSRGVGFAQSPGEAPRTLGRGLQLKEGDRLTTSDG